MTDQGDRCLQIAACTTRCVIDLQQLAISYSCSTMDEAYLVFLEGLILDLEKFVQMNYCEMNVAHEENDK